MASEQGAGTKACDETVEIYQDAVVVCSSSGGVAACLPSSMEGGEQGGGRKHAAAASPPSASEQPLSSTLQRKRIEAGLTIDALSTMTKIPRAMLRRYESGEEAPDLVAMRIIEVHLFRDAGASKRRAPKGAAGA